MKRLIQITNSSIGAVADGAKMPLGVADINCSCQNCPSVYDLVSSNADVVRVGRGGYYCVKYFASVVAAAAGTMAITLYVGGTAVYTFSQTVVEGETVSVAFERYIYLANNCNVLPNAIPAYVSFGLSGVALTGGVSTTIIEA